MSYAIPDDEILTPDEKDEPRRLAALMFTDIVGYAAQSQKNEARALRDIEEDRALLRSNHRANDGAEVKSAGNGSSLQEQR